MSDRLRRAGLLPVGLLLALACSGGAPDAPQTDPTPPAPPDATGAQPMAPWPLFEMARLPLGRSVPLPPGAKLLDLDVAPTGMFATLVTGDDVTTRVWTWDFTGPLVPIQATNVVEVALSPFDNTAYALVQALPEWRIERGRLDARGGWTAEATVYKSDAHLSALTTTLAHYAGDERIFFARDHTAGRSQILSVRRDGTVPYEVTSPEGVLGPLTPAEVRAPPDGYTQPPLVLEAASARPLSVNARDGTLYWQDELGVVHARAWDDGANNWGADRAATPQPADWRWSPNSYYTVVWDPKKPGVELRDPAGATYPIPGPTFRAAPVMAENGRALVGWSDAGVVTVGIDDPLAAVRYLHTTTQIDALRKNGMASAPSKADQIYALYDELLYGYSEAPVYASLDGMLEVLHTGFQAVFVRVERDVSRPRLAAFLEALEAAAARVDERRVREIASITKRMLNGDYASPEGERVRAESAAPSELHLREVDFADFHPRGPYATSEDLANYFRAFKYVDLLELTESEQRTVGADPAVQAAWKAWIDAQSPYLSGTRYQGMFGDFPLATPHADPACVPTRIQEHPRRVFPLSWGRDSEVLERVTAHDDLPEGCTVPQRVVPSGLDLLTAFGSPFTLAVQRQEYERWPALEATHANLRQRFSADIPSDRLPDAWFRLVQILGNDAAVPEGVSGDMWRRRLWETALASWASFRHTTVLVNEASAAQMGDGGPEGFEWHDPEPPRHVVDPVPAAWAQLGGMLDKLADAAKTSPTTDRLAEVLAEAGTNATRLGKLSELQMANKPLTEEDYAFIARFAGTVEHPFMVFSAAAAGKEDEFSRPDPMMRIVDVHIWSDPTGPTQFWHAAVGRPRAITLLLGDRGLLLPAQGGVYSYYEVLNTQRVDDAGWRARVDAAPRLGWANP
jgi:hypothetical protein